MKQERSLSAGETERIAGALARKLLRMRRTAKKALVVRLKGNLGSGKTTFVRGFLKTCGVRGPIASPTFVLVRRYRIPKKNPGGITHILHIDAYRIAKPAELSMLGFKEWLNDPGALIMIEWPERVRSILPPSALRIGLKHGRKKHERIITLPHTLSVSNY